MPETNTTAVAAALAGTGMIRVIAWTRPRCSTNTASTMVSRPRSSATPAIRSGARSR